jgi:hypothetical protein
MGGLILAHHVRMKVKLYKHTDTILQALVAALFFLWNVIEGAVFENTYPLAMVNLYQYPIFRILFLSLILISVEWSKYVAIMIAFSLFFYIMDMEVTNKKWSKKDLKRESK